MRRLTVNLARFTAWGDIHPHQWTIIFELIEPADWVVRYSLLGDQVVVSRQLLLVAGFIGLVSGLQFAVSVLTDAGYRSELAQDMTEEIRAALAVRAVYHRRLVG